MPASGGAGSGSVPASGGAGSRSGDVPASGGAGLDRMPASGGAGCVSGGALLRAALEGGAAAASQSDTQDLVNDILQSGHLPSQSRRSSAKEKQNAVRLIRARKAGKVSWQQEAQLRELQPATRDDLEDSGASAGASTQAQGSASSVTVHAGGRASQLAAAISGDVEPGRLIRARKAVTLTRQQEAQLRALEPATRDGAENSSASAGASRQAQSSASAVMVHAGGGASQPAAAGSGPCQPPAAAGAEEAELKKHLRLRQNNAAILQKLREFGRLPKENPRRGVDERKFAEQLRRVRKTFSPDEEAEYQAILQAFPVQALRDRYVDRQIDG